MRTGWLALTIAAAIGPADAAPIVEVRARTSIQLDPISRVPGGIRISGRVTDLASPEPIANATVEIRFDGAVYYVRTGDDGRFAVDDIPASEGRHDVEVAVSPTDQYDASTETLRDFDVSKEPLQLDLSAQLVGDDDIEIVLRASSAGLPAELRTALWAGDLDDPELKRLGDLRTDSRGRATLKIGRGALGGFGQKRAEARFPGDDTYDPAIGSTRFTIEAAATITLSIDDSDIAFEDELRGRGVVRDEDGEILAGQRVALIAAGREVAEATTDDRGGYKLSVEASELGEGELQVHAELFPSDSWIKTARSEPRAIRIGEQRPVPVGATLAAFGATCLALLAFVGLRTRPWESWLARLRRREPEEQKSDQPNRPRPTGLAPARPSLVSTLRRPADHGFSGVVADAVTGRPIAGAAVKLALGDEVRRVTTEAGGLFQHEALGPGEWSAKVSADGYVSERFSVTIPHRGELRDARVDLLSVRERIFDLYGEVAAPLLPKPDLWGVWTPRQTVDHVRRQRPAPALAHLTDYVEEIYFSQRSPDEGDLERATSIIDAARRELRYQA
jgi:hypothetical protein